MQRIDHPVFIHMKVKRVVRVGRVMRVAILGFIPADDLSNVLDQGFAFSDIHEGKNAFSVNAGAANLNTAICHRSRFFGHG